MQRESDDRDLWGDLYDRYRSDDMPPRDADARPWWSYGIGGRGRGRAGSLPPESKARLLDAALGIVGSIRTFAEVAEDVLLEQRDRLGDVAPSSPRPEEAWFPHEPAPRRPTPAAGPNVQDIPMEDDA